MAEMNTEESASGADPGQEDDLAAREKELAEITQDHGDDGASTNPDEMEDEIENSENLVAQGSDPEAQES